MLGYDTSCTWTLTAMLLQVPGGVGAWLWLVLAASSAVMAIPTAHNATSSVTAASQVSPTPALEPRQDTGAAGGVTITEPPQTAQASFYKIAPHVSVTFGWSFTSLDKKPDKLFVVASCSKNGNTYPIAGEPSGLPGDATDVTWYPYGYHRTAPAHGQPDLVAATYRLMVYDQAGPSAVPKSGGFMPNSNVQFSLYFPLSYTPLSGACDWSYLLTQSGSAAPAVAPRPLQLTRVRAAHALPSWHHSLLRPSRRSSGCNVF